MNRSKLGRFLIAFFWIVGIGLLLGGISVNLLIAYAAILAFVAIAFVAAVIRRKHEAAKSKPKASPDVLYAPIKPPDYTDILSMIHSACSIAASKPVKSSLQQEGPYVESGSYPSDWRKRRELVFKRDGNRCVLCGTDLKGTIRHVHHIVMKAMSHNHDFNNLVGLCIDCHSVLPGHERMEWYCPGDRFTEIKEYVLANYDLDALPKTPIAIYGSIGKKTALVIETNRPSNEELYRGALLTVVNVGFSEDRATQLLAGFSFEHYTAAKFQEFLDGVLRLRYPYMRR